MKIDHHRSLLDPATCQTFTEVIVTNTEKPYVLGTRLRVNRDKIAEIEILWTTTGYWLFNADAYLKWSSSEKWDTIPVNKRDTRDTLVSAANAYLDAFLEGKEDLVPWGYPCNRTEGGAHTGNGSPMDSLRCRRPERCEHRQPPFHRRRNDRLGGRLLHVRRWRPGGGSGAPDTHLFRIENGKLRYVHTLHASTAGELPRQGCGAAALEVPTEARRRILRVKKKDPRSGAGSPSVSRRFLKESRHTDGL
jgi:hypothetical protein